MTTLGLVTLAQIYRGDIVRQINRSVTLLKSIKIVTGEGKNLAWVAQSSGALAENYADGADAANFGQDAQAPAILSWGLYRANVHVSQLTMDAASTSHSPDGNLQYWARAVFDGAAELAKKVEKDCFSGAGTGTLVAGLDVAIGSDSNTYAGIDRSIGGNAYWRPSVTDPGVPTSLTFSQVRDDLRKIFEASGETPRIAVCTPTVFNIFGNLFDATRRQVFPSVTTARGQISLDAGFHALELDGTVFMKALDATANTMYYINDDDMELQVLPAADQRMLLAATKVAVDANDGYGTVPLNMSFQMLAKLGASERGMAFSTCQLKVGRPNKHGVRKNISA